MDEASIRASVSGFFDPMRHYADGNDVVVIAFYPVLELARISERSSKYYAAWLFDSWYSEGDDRAASVAPRAFRFVMR